MQKSKNDKKSVIILSGGIDSTTLLYLMIGQGLEPYAISYDYGQKHAKELLCAAKTCQKLGVPHKILNLSVLNEVAPSALTRKEIEVPEGHYEAENMKVTIVPNRNMVMLAIATSYAIGIGATNVFYGAHIGDSNIYPDCRVKFVKAMGKVMKLCDWNEVKLFAPFIKLHKNDIIAEGLRLNVDYSLTWSCYSPKDGRPCLKCGTDIERTESFLKNNVKDPLLTNNEWEKAVDYYEEVMRGN